jgi:hypothetical protein
MAAPSDGSPAAGPKLQGLKYLDRLLPLFDRLHEVGCQRARAGNRKLHFDHYCRDSSLDTTGDSPAISRFALES